MTDAIVAERLVVRYRGKAALDGLDMRVPRGAVYAFLGDNGAGKTTTMKVLTGLAPADSGRASILGLDSWTHAAELRHRVGYMPERPRFYDWMTVAEIGWFTGCVPPARIHRPLPRMGRAARARPLQAAPQPLQGRLRPGRPGVGPGPDPEVLLLDEPTSGLDLLTRREFLAGLGELAAAGRTVLISSHSIAELERACSHVGLIRDGRMAMSATLDDLRKKVRRISLRFADRAAGPGRPRHRVGAERNGALPTGAAPRPRPRRGRGLEAGAGGDGFRGRPGDLGRGLRRADGEVVRAADTTGAAERATMRWCRQPATCLTLQPHASQPIGLLPLAGRAGQGDAGHRQVVLFRQVEHLPRVFRPVSFQLFRASFSADDSLGISARVRRTHGGVRGTARAGSARG